MYTFRTFIRFFFLFFIITIQQTFFSSSFDPLSSTSSAQQQNQQQLSQNIQHSQQTHQQHSLQTEYFGDNSGASNLDIFSDILFGQQSSHHQPQQQQSQQSTQNYSFSQANRLVELSSSSSETLVAGDNTSHFGSNDSIPNSLVHQQYPIQSSSQSIDSEQEKKLFFDRSSTENLGLLTLRSNSDPTIALHSLQQARQQQQLQQQQQQHSAGLTDISQNVPSQTNQPTPSAAAAIAESSLPSFQDIYPIKYNQLETFGLKMDEDCYNLAQTHHHANINYHHGHGHQHHAMHQEHFEYQQNPQQFMSPNFYPYDQPSMVSNLFSVIFSFLINVRSKP